MEWAGAEGAARGAGVSSEGEGVGPAATGAVEDLLELGLLARGGGEQEACSVVGEAELWVGEDAMGFVEEFGEVLAAAEVGVGAQLAQDDAIGGLDHRRAGPRVHLEDFVVIVVRVVLRHGMSRQ